MVRITMEAESRGQMRIVGNIVCRICSATGSVHLVGSEVRHPGTDGTRDGTRERPKEVARSDHLI